MGFPWDSTNLGDITSLIEFNQKFDFGLVVWVNGGQMAVVNKYRDSIPLVVDELKSIFGLVKIGRHRCVIAGYDVILSRLRVCQYQFCSSLIANNREIYVPNIRRSLVFRTILCLSRNTEHSLTYIPRGKSGFITSYYDIEPRKQGVDPKLSQAIVNKWFGTWDEVRGVARTFSQIKDLRNRLSAVIRRVDPSKISLVHRIISRIDEES